MGGGGGRRNQKQRATSTKEKYAVIKKVWKIFKVELVVLLLRHNENFSLTRSFRRCARTRYHKRFAHFGRLKNMPASSCDDLLNVFSQVAFLVFLVISVAGDLSADFGISFLACHNTWNLI